MRILKLLLKKKISEISRISQQKKLKDSGKLVKALSRIINTMKDLQSLATERGIVSRFYSGDGIEIIYQCLALIE